MQTINRHLFRYLLLLVLLSLLVGTVFYHLVEKWSWLNAYYFSVVTLATVGYGDFSPHTAAGKIFTTFYIMGGVGIVTTFFSALIRRRAEKVHTRHKVD